MGNGRRQINSLGLQYLHGVMQAGMKVVRRDSRIVVDDLLFRPPIGEQVDEELNRQPRSLDHGFADEHARVNLNAFLLAHDRSWSIFLNDGLFIIVRRQRRVVNSRAPARTNPKRKF